MIYTFINTGSIPFQSQEIEKRLKEVSNAHQICFYLIKIQYCIQYCEISLQFQLTVFCFKM